MDKGKGRIFPNWEQIQSFKNPLTAGELALAKYLDDYLPPNWEIYVRPFFNGNFPDIVILGRFKFQVQQMN